jgi:hypothetical protein
MTSRACRHRDLIKGFSSITSAADVEQRAMYSSGLNDSRAFSESPYKHCLLSRLISFSIPRRVSRLSLDMRGDCQCFNLIGFCL